MAITAGQVKELRAKTGVGMMECKKALQENDGDLEKAILWLRERGLSRAAKKADRVTSEGIVQVTVNDDFTAGVVIEVNCETDFVSKNQDFIDFCKEISGIALEGNISDVDALKAAKLASGETVENKLTSLISTIGENLNLRRVKTIKDPEGTIVGYTHMGGKIGTLVQLSGARGDELQELCKDIAMHVAAAAPRYLNSSEVDPAELEQEKDLARKKLLEQNKPENLIDKIMQGQINKFYKEVCLVEQAFVKDPNLSITKLVKEKGKGSTLTSFVRFNLGEGIEKKKENFAEEVAAAAQTK